ncbi:hypothetical protein HN51_017476 [Arachis hypogaea]|nr:Homeobox-leucine zipper protein [Arachis hypogaea]
MNFDHGVSNTSLQLGLALGIGFHHQEKNCMKKKEDDPSRKCNNKAYPSLTLGPAIIDDDNHNNQASKIIEDSNSSPSAVSSFSNSSIIIKKEKDQEFEVEIDEKAPSSSRDEDGNNTKRKKLRLSKEQSIILEESFKNYSNPNPKQKQELATHLHLLPRQVEVWFQNRRARTKLKQTESDCEFLKKCYESLTEENKRLQNELQELKSMQTTPPFSMQIPPTTLTICPSCEKIWYNNNNNNNNNGELLLISSKTHQHHNHFYKNNGYPLFKHSSSATC